MYVLRGGTCTDRKLLLKTQVLSVCGENLCITLTSFILLVPNTESTVLPLFQASHTNTFFAVVQRCLFFQLDVHVVQNKHGFILPLDGIMEPFFILTQIITCHKQCFVWLKNRFIVYTNVSLAILRKIWPTAGLKLGSFR